MPKRFPKRYLFLAFAVCIALLSLLDLLQTPSEANMHGSLLNTPCASQVSARVSLAD